MKKRYFSLVISIIMLTSFSCTIVYAEASGPQTEYTITNINELRTEIGETLENGKMSNNDKEEIINETSPQVLNEFIQEKITCGLDEVGEVMSSIDPDEYGNIDIREKVNLKDGANVVIEILDKPEASSLSEDESQALAKNGEVVSKPYGNRYFTAKATVTYGIGIGSVALENHYHVGSNGLTERYASSYIPGGVGSGSITPGDKSVYGSAKKVGESAGAKGYFYVDTVIKGVHFQGTFYVNATITLKELTSKSAKVKHSWTNGWK